MFLIDDDLAYADFKAYLATSPKIISVDAQARIIKTEEYEVQVEDRFCDLFNFAPKYDHLIFGKDQTENVVSVEIKDSKTFIFQEINGRIEVSERPHEYWAIGAYSPQGEHTRLKGNQFFRFLRTFTDHEEFDSVLKIARKKGIFLINNPKEATLVREGITYFKGMKVGDVSALFFDLETTGLNPEASDAKILMISNTFRSQGVIERKLFSIDDYDEDEGKMIAAWVAWVKEKDPSIISGFNIISFDFRYLIGRAKANRVSLNLGRDHSEIEVEKYTRQFRKDGSQSYSYNRINIFGREIIDVFFLIIKYDIGRKYTSYKLKTIIKEEGLEDEGRTHYDAGTIKVKWADLEERKKIKKYGIEDSDDALKLYDLAIPSFFYLTQAIPKPFQLILESASGSQLNAFMLRSYLQIGHSIPKADEAEPFEGAISLGIPGVYSNVFKIDVASLYPSIMLQFKVEDKTKDPLGHFQKSLEHFTLERLKNKKLGKDTGDRYYKDLDQSQKIIINSMYGFMGAANLNFNSPKNAAFVTKKGREILNQAIQWATGRFYDGESVQGVQGREED
jgi:DNA polymerase I